MKNKNDYTQSNTIVEMESEKMPGPRKKIKKDRCD